MASLLPSRYVLIINSAHETVRHSHWVLSYSLSASLACSTSTLWDFSDLLIVLGVKLTLLDYRKRRCRQSTHPCISIVPLLGELPVSLFVSASNSSSFKLSKVFGFSFLSFRLSGADIRPKFGTDLWILFKGQRRTSHLMVVWDSLWRLSPVVPLPINPDLSSVLDSWSCCERRSNSWASELPPLSSIVPILPLNPLCDRRWYSKRKPYHRCIQGKICTSLRLGWHPSHSEMLPERYSILAAFWWSVTNRRHFCHSHLYQSIFRYPLLTSSIEKIFSLPT